MRVVFMGTPDFAVPSLRALAAAFEVTLVVTRPDAVRSRGKRLEPSPVKRAATELGLPVLEASRVTPEVLKRLQQAAPDVICVAAFGCILPDELLQLPPAGCVNVHASLLPRWRGAAPIQRAILAGDEKTGVSIMRIAHGVDTGDYCAQASCSVAGKTADELTRELAELGAGLLVDVLPHIVSGEVVWRVQDESRATHAAKLTKSELMLDPEASAQENALRILASSDAAPARLVLAGTGARVLRAEPLEGTGLLPAQPAPGSFAIADGRLLLGCAEGLLEVLELKPESKRTMEASAWAAGRRERTGSWGRPA